MSENIKQKVIDKKSEIEQKLQEFSTPSSNDKETKYKFGVMFGYLQALDYVLLVIDGHE